MFLLSLHLVLKFFPGQVSEWRYCGRVAGYEFCVISGHSLEQPYILLFSSELQTSGLLSLLPALARSVFIPHGLGSS